MFSGNRFAYIALFVDAIMLIGITTDAIAIPRVSPLTLSAKKQDPVDTEVQKAIAFLEKRQFDKAELAFKRLLKTHNRCNDNTAADIYNFIGVALHAQKKENQAAEYFRKSLSLIPAVDLSHKRMRAKVFANLSGVYAAEGQYKRAEDSYLEAIKLFKECKSSAKELAVVLASYGRMKIELKDFKAAEPLIRESINLREKTAGATSMELISPLVNLSNVLLEEGLYKEALAICKRAVTICEKNDGLESKMLFPLLMNLATIQIECNDAKSATESYQRALLIAEKTYSPNGDEALSSLLSITEAAQRSNQKELALKSLRRALEICRKSFGHNDERTLQATEALADLEQLNGNPAEAQRLRLLSRLSKGNKQ